MQSGEQKPSLRQHNTQPQKADRDSDVCRNILAAAVTHLISDERRANINNMIKQKINSHRNQLLE